MNNMKHRIITSKLNAVLDRINGAIKNEDLNLEALHWCQIELSGSIDMLKDYVLENYAESKVIEKQELQQSHLEVKPKEFVIFEFVGGRKRAYHKNDIRLLDYNGTDVSLFLKTEPASICYILKGSIEENTKLLNE